MPKATIYIKVENWEAWQAMEAKSDWVNGHLKIEFPAALKPQEED